MGLMLTAMIGDLKYYVQYYKGEWRLNGLRDNAKIWTSSIQMKQDFHQAQSKIFVELKMEETKK